MDITVDGRRVFAATGGQPFDAGLPTTLFIHGAAFDHTVWKLQARYFAWHGNSVLALDLPGHGRSEGPPLGSIPEISDWIVRVLDAAGAAQAALVGHSMGALIALEAAGRHTERVRALALLGAATAIPVNDVLMNAAEANDHLAMDLLNAWGYGRRAQYGGHRVPGMWMMRGGLRILERAGEDLLYTDLRATNAYSEGEAAADAVRCPTLIVIGENDVMTPAPRGRALAARIAGAQAVVIPQVGHIMLEEAPDETLDALRDMLLAPAPGGPDK